MPEHDPGAAHPNRTEDVRLAVYTSFALTGSAPDAPQLAERTGLTVAEAQQELQRLHASRDLVLDAHDSDHIVMAHPFASIPFGFSVMGARTLRWGGCAWDSFAIPHLLPDEPDVLATRPALVRRAHGTRLHPPRSVLGRHLLRRGRTPPRVLGTISQLTGGLGGSGGRGSYQPPEGPKRSVRMRPASWPRSTSRSAASSTNPVGPHT